MKTCSTCQTRKPVSAFSRDKQTRDGLAYRCKECEIIRQRERRNTLHHYVATDREKRQAVLRMANKYFGHLLRCHREDVEQVAECAIWFMPGRVNKLEFYRIVQRKFRFLSKELGYKAGQNGWYKVESHQLDENTNKTVRRNNE